MAEDRNLPSRLSREDQNALQSTGKNSGRLLDLAVSNLSETELATLRAKAIDEQLRLEVDAKERDNKYYDGRRSAQDHIDAFNMLEKGGKLTSQKVTTDIETGAGKMRIESKSGATCFVASAAYDDPNHPDVMFLRKFRDTRLKTSAAGRVFISLYWKAGPIFARPVACYPLLRRVARSLIESIVRILKQT